MNQDWQAFLLSQGGEPVADGGVRFSAPPQAPDQFLVCSLSHYGIIGVRGEEAAEFLHNLLTNSIRDLAPDRSQLAALCTPKGRMQALFRVWRGADTFYLRTPASLVEGIVKRLRMYVLRSKVTVDDLSQELASMGLSGPRHHIRELLGADPDAGMVAGSEAATLVAVPGEVGRVEVYGPAGQLQDLWLRSGATPVSSAQWRLLDIRSGQPQIYPETVEAFVPQMLNLQLVDGLSFTKGCYPGQEVVARMQFLGELKRRMYRIHFPEGADPKPGDELVVAEKQAGQWAGKLVDTQPDPEGGYEALACLKIADLDNQVFHLNEVSGPAAQLRTLPYPFEPAEN